jgi:predicted flap endonuclease-1-like 5' DNA nuclease
LKSTSGENERLAKQLHQAEARIAELQSDLNAQKSLLETATKNASGLEQEYVSVETSLKESSELLKTSRADCAAALSAQKVAEESLAQLKLDHESSQQQIEELQSKVANMDSLEAQVLSLQEACGNSREQLEKVSLQRDTTMDAEKQAIAQCTGLQKRIDNQEATIHTLRAKHDDAMENLKMELSRRTELESNFESKSAEMLKALAVQKQLQEQTELLQRESGDLSSKFEKEQSELHSKLTSQTESLEKLSAKRETEVAELQNRISMQTETIQQLTSKRESVESDLTEVRGKLVATLQERTKEQSELQTQIASQTNTIEQLTGNRDSVESELNTLKQELVTTTNELDSARQQTSELTVKVEELKTTCLRISELEKLVQKRDQADEQVIEELRTLREQYAESFAKQQELQTELDLAMAKQAEIESESTKHDHQLKMLRMKLKASEETIRTLRRERAAVLARLANYRTIAEPEATVISFTEAMQRRQRDATYYDQEYGGHTSQHAVRGLVYTEAPDTKDDLKLISGIAEVLEARLNDYGIYTFKQIKEWKPEAIEEFSRLLAFRDRIERDEWLAQAGNLYEKKQRTVAA